MSSRTAKVVAAAVVTAGLFAFASAAPAATYLVQPNGSGDYATIQDAIDAVVDTDIIELADGTFDGPGNRDLDFLGKGITIRSQSGDPTACVIDCGGDEFDPHRGFWFHTGEGSSSVVQDISIVHGYMVDANGGAILCESAAPIIQGCILGSNIVDGPGVRGGAIACSGSSEVTIAECRFIGNTAGEFTGGEGGAISVTTSAEAWISECVIGPGNYAGARGGGVYCSSPVAVFGDCTITDNGAPIGAGICSDSDFVVLEGCELLWNQAVTGAGSGGGLAVFGEANVTACTFMGNRAAVAGGGIFLGDGASGEIVLSIVAYGLMGGGIYGQAPTRDVTIACCDVFENTGGNYGGTITDQTGIEANFSGDPLFCNAPVGDLTVYNTSPCASANSPCGEETIGANDVGCDTAVEQSSWGEIKAIHR
jgi:hypothetical protein